jgi:DNA helicase-2/ATP-dependent DNA helicase PcrA
MESFNLGKRRTLEEIGNALPEMLPSIKFALAAHRSGEEVIRLPKQYSVSALVAIAADQERMARMLRRPMPHAPTFESRRGTEFHLWVENHLKRPALIDLDDDELGFEDELSEMPLDEMQSKWLASEWSSKEIYDVEVPFDLAINDITISGRIDAIYREGNTWSVVDWKTGSVKSGEELAAAAVQLAVYRLAFAKLENISLADVSGAFYYVPTNTTIRPADLLDESELAELITRFHNRVKAEDGH